MCYSIIFNWWPIFQNFRVSAGIQISNWKFLSAIIPSTHNDFNALNRIEIGSVFSEIWSVTDKQTNRQTNTHTRTNFDVEYLNISLFNHHQIFCVFIIWVPHSINTENNIGIDVFYRNLESAFSALTNTNILFFEGFALVKRMKNRVLSKF